MTRGIILSGGWGTRLRPLTCTTPKTLIPVVNVPVIERQMLLLKEAGVSEIVLAVSVMSEELKAYFKEGERLGLKIYYTNEENPMGTAGAVKLAENLLKDDNFFMLNGDVILNFDFKEMLDLHNEKGGIGTIASRMVDDPSRYGVLLVDEETQQIKNFLEKDEYCPPEGKCVPMPINAGVYILEPEIFSFIPPNKKVSIELDVFPKAAQKSKVFHYPITGIWKDIGKPEELLQGNVILLKDLLKKSSKKNLIAESANMEGRVEIYPPVAIGENTVLRNNCKIGPNVVIGNNVFIEKDSEIKDSLIYSESYISEGATIENAIIADNVNINKNVQISGKMHNPILLSSYVKVLDDIKLIVKDEYPISVCHHEVVKESIE